MDNYTYYMCDFETTVYEGQTNTEVWASACVEFGTEDVKIFHSIEQQYQYFICLQRNIVCYYHNLKFDGAFWINYILTELNYRPATLYYDENETGVHTEFDRKNRLKNGEFLYSISNRGQWYSITIKDNDHTIDIRDSMKLLPFSVERIGKSF